MLRPLQILAAASLCLMLFGSAVLGRRIYAPDFSSLIFCFKHYLGPLAVGILAAGASGVAWNWSKGTSRKIILDSLADLVAFAAVVFVHFNLKLWSHLVNGAMFDNEFHQIDEALAPLRDGLISIAQAVTERMPLEVPYSDLFISMFFLSFFIHGGFGGRRELNPVMLATAVVLSLGGISYWIAPAFGPLIFDPPNVAYVRYMHSFSASFVDSGGRNYSPVMFVSMLAAMPSLHIANSVVLAYFAWKWRPWLLAFYVPAILFFLCEGVNLRFHYLIDYPAGLLIAGLSLIICSTWLRLPSAFLK
jgi:hypothetical protein